VGSEIDPQADDALRFRYSSFPIGFDRSHRHQTTFSFRGGYRGPQRQVFVAGVDTGVPSDRSSSLGWKQKPSCKVPFSPGELENFYRRYRKDTLIGQLPGFIGSLPVRTKSEK
jgi:hypothetical protein